MEQPAPHHYPSIPAGQFCAQAKDASCLAEQKNRTPLLENREILLQINVLLEQNSPGPAQFLDSLCREAYPLVWI
ncbi:MAG: hypothetical protein GXY42_03825 [Desulfovibrionales bacterium]|nr:hypothetical protein [Desulfovibrionales bacterium]